MADSINKASVVSWPSVLGYVIGTVLLLVLAASWFVLGPLEAFAYVAGWFSSMWAFLAVLTSVLWLVPGVAICVPVAAVYTAWRWRRLTIRDKWCCSMLTVLACAFTTTFVMGVFDGRPGLFRMFMRGFERYVERKTDVEAIQNWVSALNPDDCQGQLLDEETGSGTYPPQRSRSVPTPPSIASLRPHHTRLRQDDTGKPLVQIAWGSSHLAWGLLVSSSDMSLLQAHEQEWRDQGWYCEDNELRKPLTWRAYIWLRLD